MCELWWALLDGFKRNDVLTYPSAISFQILTAVVSFAMTMVALAGLLHLDGVWPLRRRDWGGTRSWQLQLVSWMAFVAALIAAEELLPWAKHVLGITVPLAMIGVSVALAPDRVPGLVLPDSAEGREARTRIQSSSMHERMKQDRGGGSKHDSMDRRTREEPMDR